MTMGLVGGIGLLVCAGALWLLVGAAAEGRLSRNGEVGIRTRSTTASDAAWLAGHRAAAGPARLVALVCGLFAVAMAVASVAAGTAEPSALTVALFVGGYVVMIAGAVLVARAASRGARAGDHA